jgi:hypothetical protein
LELVFRVKPVTQPNPCGESRKIYFLRVINYTKYFASRILCLKNKNKNPRQALYIESIDIYVVNNFTVMTDHVV